VPVYEALRVEPFLVLKVAMPLLFGLNTCGVYFLAVKGFGWSVRKGLFAAGLFSFQFAALGISWHFYRNMLGLGILLFTVPWILREKLDVKSLAVFSILGVFAVFSHEYASVLLLVSVIGVVVSKGLKGRKAEALKVVGAAIPAIVIFAGSIFLRLYPVYSAVQPNVLMAYQTSGHYSGPLFFMTDYLNVLDTVQYYPSYVDLMASVVSLFAVLYVAILPLAVIGFFRNRVLDVWTVLLSVGAFGCLLVPFFALNYWSRWMLMLVFPLTFYGTHGFVKALHSAKPVAASLWRLGSLGISKRIAKGLVLVSVTAGFVFMTSPMFFDKGGVFGLATTVNYLPSTMLCNAVPLSDVESTVEVFQWANTALDNDSCILTHDAFFNWAKLSLDDPHTIVFFKNNINDAVDQASEQGFKRFWLVWWNENIGWYGFETPATFHPIFNSGRLSVFEYVG